MNRSLPLWLVFTLSVLSAASASAQVAPVKPSPVGTLQIAPTKPAEEAAPADRSQAYFHAALAGIYEDEAATQGRQDLVNQAIEEYKAALNADPGSPGLNGALADLYFRTGRVHDAEVTARALLKSSPDNLDAHKLLGRIYLRQLSEGQAESPAAAAPANVLDLAIAEFEKIVALQPASVEDHMILGQLFTVRHDAKKAEEQFKAAKGIEPDSEEVVLNLARLYAESGDVDHAARVIEAVPVTDRSPKEEVALAAAYEQLKKPKEAIAAYQRAADMDPSDAQTATALAQALLNDNQLDAALKQYQELSKTDPENTEALIHIGEIQRRQGNYEAALATIRKASKKAPDSIEAGYNEGLILDVLGRFDEAAQVFERMVDQTSHANGAYTSQEKSILGTFLYRLGAVYHEQNKTEKAIAVYQKMIDLGGDSASTGYERQIDTYNDARMYDKAVAVARKAAAANSKDRDMQLMLAGELVEQGKNDEGIAIAKGLLDNSKNDRGVWLAFGQMYVLMHRWKDAEEALAKAEALTTEQPDRAYLLFLKGELAERQKHYEVAEQFFRAALDLDPASARTLNYLGYMLADKGMRLPEALKLIRKAVEIEPMDGAYMDSLGWAYFKMGEYELAEDNLRRAVERDANDPTVHEHLGDLYEKTGRIRLAAQQWELSLAAYAKSSPADIEQADVAKVQHKLDSARVKLAKQENATGQNKPE